MTTEFTAVVLAGGRSSRMGRDKALIDWHGQPLIDHMVRLLRDAGASVRVSGDRPAHGGIPDAAPDRGPVGGILSVVPHCPDGVVLVVPVDMPLLAAGRVHRLREALGTCAAAYFEGHPLPCGVRLDTVSRARLHAFAGAHGRASVRDLLAAFGARALPADDEGDLRPCNTPADLAALQR